MPFRFRINERWKARPPVVVLTGDLLEGEVRIGDLVVVPLLDGGTLKAKVIAVLPGWADRTVEAASVGDGYEWVGIAFERQGDHRADDIALGCASDPATGKSLTE